MAAKPAAREWTVQSAKKPPSSIQAGAPGQASSIRPMIRNGMRSNSVDATSIGLRRHWLATIGARNSPGSSQPVFRMVGISPCIQRSPASRSISSGSTV